MKLFIVENNDLLSEAIIRLVRQHPDLHRLNVAGYAVSRNDAWRQISQIVPNIVLLDLSIADQPGNSAAPQHGLALLQDIRQMVVAPRVLVYSQWHHPRYLWAAWEQGAKGFLEKDSSSAELVVALKMIITENYAFTSAQLQIIQQRQALPELTDREQEVLELLARGLGKDAIARTLHISKGTVNSHMRNLFTKFHVHNQVELLAAARRLGVIL